MIITRFPPSPTGFVHIGSLRTALYNYVYARKHGGKFLLRIEDTDRSRLVEGAVENLISTLKWAGISYDEGPDIGGPHAPYIQSERLALYTKAAEELLSKGAAYYCFCTAERLEQMRKDQQARNLAPKYDRHCAKLTSVEIQKNLELKIPFVLRQSIPDNRSVTWDDAIRNRVSFESKTIDDQVLVKSDGYPTYHLANVVDDHDMEVTHVIRGEEWLSSTPKHILLYESFGWTIPTFGHLPLLLNKDRSKLSKRQGDVAVEDYKKKGYLPEALVNFVALLGWHPGGDDKQEIFSMEDLIDKFSLEKVHKAGAVFDLEKLDWINWQWRRKKFEAMPGEYMEKLFVIAREYVPIEWQQLKNEDDFQSGDFLRRCLKTVAEKVIKDPSQTPSFINFYFGSPFMVNKDILCNQKMNVTTDVVKKVFTKVIDSLGSFEDFDSEEKIKEHLISVIAELGLKNGQVLWPLRVALTNEEFSPGVFEVIWALGKKRTLARINDAFSEVH